MFLTPNGTQVVLWVHVLAACIWIGGQVTIALLIPLLRGQPGLLSAGAHRYQVLAWTAFALLVVTGLLNVQHAGLSWSHLAATPRGRTLLLKLGFVALSGAAAALHAMVAAPRAASTGQARARRLSGMLGIMSLLAAVLAALYGVIIAAE